MRNSWSLSNVFQTKIDNIGFHSALLPYLLTSVLPSMLPNYREGVPAASTDMNFWFFKIHLSLFWIWIVFLLILITSLNNLAHDSSSRLPFFLLWISLLEQTQIVNAKKWTELLKFLISVHFTELYCSFY